AALLLPGILGRRPDAADPRQREEVERAAEELPGRADSGMRRSQRVDAGKVRRAESGGAAPLDWQRHQDPSVPQVGPGGRRKSVLRALRGAQGEEQALGARLSRVEEVPRRAVPVVPRRRVHLRQLFVFLEDRRAQVAYLLNCFCRSSDDSVPGLAPGAAPSRSYSGVGTMICTFEGSNFSFSTLPVTRPGNTITTPTMMTWITTNGTAPQ